MNFFTVEKSTVSCDELFHVDVSSVDVSTTDVNLIMFRTKHLTRQRVHVRGAPLDTTYAAGSGVTRSEWARVQRFQKGPFALSPLTGFVCRLQRK